MEGSDDSSDMITLFSSGEYPGSGVLIKITLYKSEQSISSQNMTTNLICACAKHWFKLILFTDIHIII